jgi:hypothetical protein
VGIREEYEQSIEYYLKILDEVTADQWSIPVRGELTVREVAAQGSRPLTTTREFIGAPADKVELHGALGYFIGTPPRDAASLEASAQRGKEALARFQVDNLAAVARQLANESIEVVRAAPDNAIAGTQLGGMYVIDYLPSRTMELTTCAAEIAEAIGSAIMPSIEVQRAVTALLSEIAIARGSGVTLIRMLWVEGMHRR